LHGVKLHFLNNFLAGSKNFPAPVSKLILLIFNFFINFSAGYMDLYYGLSLLLLIIFILKLYKSRQVSDYLNLHNILRLIIALGVFSIILLAV